MLFTPPFILLYVTPLSPLFKSPPTFPHIPLPSNYVLPPPPAHFLVLLEFFLLLGTAVFAMSLWGWLTHLHRLWWNSFFLVYLEPFFLWECWDCTAHHTSAPALGTWPSCVWSQWVIQEWARTWDESTGAPPCWKADKRLLKARYGRVLQHSGNPICGGRR